MLSPDFAVSKAGPSIHRPLVVVNLTAPTLHRGQQTQIHALSDSGILFRPFGNIVSPCPASTRGAWCYTGGHPLNRTNLRTRQGAYP